MSNTLLHIKWNCRYHIVFIPKYRRIVIYHKLKTDIRGYIQDQEKENVLEHKLTKSKYNNSFKGLLQ